MASRFARSCALAAGLALVGTAISLNLPWLIAENRRIEPRKIPLVWPSEVTALALFVRHRFARIVSPSGRTRRVSGLNLKSCVIATALDVGFTAFEAVAERVAYSSAIPAAARAVAGRSFVQPIGHRRSSSWCSSRDRGGVVRHARFTLLDEETPPPIRAGFDGGRLPVDLAIVHDRTWLDRSWLVGLP